MRFAADAPILRPEDDLLGFESFVNLIEGAVRATQPPFVFGVLGDWGTGKTSVLRLLERRFRDLEGRLSRFPDGKEIFVPIWFDAWKHENEAHIVYPLLYAIKQQYERDVSPEKHSRIGDIFQTVVATSLFAVGQVGLKAMLRTLTAGAVDLKTLEDSLKRVREAQAPSDALSEVMSVLGSWTDSVGQFASAFEALLSTYAESLVGKDDARRVCFLILVDDLDRCLPETTISILESIKHHLSVPRCIFVLAINGRVVYQTIRRKYGSEAIDGREYLEKIVNYAFYVPEITLDRDAMSRFVEFQRRTLVGGGEHKSEFDDLSIALSECNFSNPRRIKRILNRYLIYLKRPAANGQFLPNAIRLMLIAEYFPSLFQLYMRLGKEASDRIKELLDNITNVRDFEARYGTSVEPLLPQIRHMQKLFDMPATNMNAFNEQVRQIFAITRLF
ncbi:MAG: P-loop NTPase fold protein [Aggregatilineales bacterium]